MYVIFKEFGNYKITSERNYNSVVQNAGIVISLFGCNTYEEALQCAVNAGFTKENILNKTEE